MIDKKIPEVITPNFISNVIPASQQVENNSSTYDKNYFSSPTQLNNYPEKNCKNRIEISFCKLCKQRCLYFNKSTLNIAI